MSTTATRDRGNTAFPARAFVAPRTTEEIKEILMYEELARARIRELEDTIRDRQLQRLAREARRAEHRERPSGRWRIAARWSQRPAA